MYRHNCELSIEDQVREFLFNAGRAVLDSRAILNVIWIIHISTHLACATVHLLSLSQEMALGVHVSNCIIYMCTI